MDERTPERIKFHYEVEMELAARLRNATSVERRMLYRVVYGELYARVPDIPHLSASGEAGREQTVKALVGFLRQFLIGRQSFLEVGPGDLRLSLAVSHLVPEVYAADVTREVVDKLSLPRNVEFLLTDGFDFTLPDNSVDIVFSDQMMEHLHPDDALAQLRSIRRVLTAGGVYVCITPNRLCGPHDVSKYFHSVACGLHLREYTVTEVAEVFRREGFGRLDAYTVTASRPIVRVPLRLVMWAERFLEGLPRSACRGLACSAAFRWLLRARVVATK